MSEHRRRRRLRPRFPSLRRQSTRSMIELWLDRRDVAWFGQGRTRALLATGILFGLGATGTYAYWSDQGTITSASFQSGTLDVTARDSAGSSDNLTGTGPNNWSYTAFTLSSIIPSESVSKTIVVRNSGDAPLRFNATAASSNNNLTSGTTGLQVIVFDNSTAAAQTGTQAAGNRSGLCTGGTQVYSGYVSTTASSNIFTTDVALPNTGDTRSLCVRAILAAAAPNSLQNKATNVVLTLNATQVGAP